MVGGWGWVEDSAILFVSISWSADLRTATMHAHWHNPQIENLQPTFTLHRFLCKPGKVSVANENNILCIWIILSFPFCIYILFCFVQIWSESVRKIEGARLLSVILFPVFRYFLDVCYLKSSKLTLFLYLTDLLQKIVSATTGLKTEGGRLQLKTRNTNEETVKMEITSGFLLSPRVSSVLSTFIFTFIKCI